MYAKVSLEQRVLFENQEFNPGRIIAITFKRIGGDNVTIDNLITLTSTDPEYKISTDYPYFIEKSFRIQFAGAVSDQRILIVYQRLN